MILRSLIFFLLLGEFNVHGQQSSDVSVSGYLTYDPTEPIPGAIVSVMYENKLLSSTTSDENGRYYILAELMESTTYQLSINGGSEEFPIQEELTFDVIPYHTDYVIDVTIPKPITETNRGQIAYYAKNETKQFEEFEIKQILMIIEKYPEICIQFGQTLARDESEKIAEKRKVSFLKALEEAGVDMRCIQFHPITRTLQAVSEDQRSRIMGAIYSLDSRCN